MKRDAEFEAYRDYQPPEGWTLVKLRDADERRTPCYVYRLFDDAGDLLYVGSTKWPRERRYAHKKKAWWPEVESFRLTVYPNPEHARRVEWLAIATEHPRYNIAGRRPPLEVVG